MVRPFPGGADLLGKRTAIRNNMIPRHPQGYRSNTMQEKLFNRLMDVIEYDVAPLTRKRVAIGPRRTMAGTAEAEPAEMVADGETAAGAASADA